MKVSPIQIAESQVKPGVALVTVSGKVMLGAEPAVIEETIARLLARGDRKIVVDLSGVSHIDSTGIGTFIASLGKVSQAGGALAMAAATGVVREGFRITRLDRVFRFYPDVESALKAI